MDVCIFNFNKNVAGPMKRLMKNKNFDRMFFEGYGEEIEGLINELNELRNVVESQREEFNSTVSNRIELENENILTMSFVDN